eukprot:CAMPEP_0116897792 /NCGR_PEP_ID=MMETSP0467-20121206/6676_1 /TAXON_ID=283647 /ORGANISM="Mesodinium pulex, Strain SPMC105" /LENGTH=94 /DNA_ID=CAMNT_0004569597 /DNA_START=192 /DNA_END=476 /DNA_ORIENTATION=-
MDKDGNHTIDMAEFVEFMVQSEIPKEAIELRRTFEVIEGGYRDQVSRNDMLRFYKQLGFKVTRKDINAIYDNLQIGINQSMSYQTFISIVAGQQ